MYDLDDVKKIKQALKTGVERHAPKRKAWTLGRLIQESKDAINDLRQRGYTIDQICQMITEGGFEASQSTLRRHISAVREQRDKPRKRGRGTRTAGSRDRKPEAKTGEPEAKAATPTTERPSLPRGELELVPDRDDL